MSADSAALDKTRGLADRLFGELTVIEQKIRSLHVRSRFGYCNECRAGTQWPCETVRIFEPDYIELGAPVGDESHPWAANPVSAPSSAPVDGEGDVQ